MPDVKITAEFVPPERIVSRTNWNRELVRAWVVDWFHNVGLPTHVQNRISEAAEDLVRRLAKE